MKGRPKSEKRGTDYIWMYVTDDQFEFPIYIEDSVTDLAQRLGKTEMAIRTAVSHSERKGRKSQYAGEEMIKLTVDGACKECPLRSIKVLDGIGEPIARCEHQTVCKYIEKEGYKDTTTGKKTP